MIFKLKNSPPKKELMKKVILGSGLPDQVPVLSITGALFCSEKCNGLDAKFYEHPMYGIFAVLSCVWYFSSYIVIYISCNVQSLKEDCKLLENINHFISYFFKIYLRALGVLTVQGD